MTRHSARPREHHDPLRRRPAEPNFIFTPEGWRYLVRLYGTQEEIADGSFQFPKPQPLA